ncbi:SDR family NAD(P)-dependent oxidoreductase [Listeria seeligeri]|uniref:SDR family NAD(P)-dependent oxidoreductase n=1 Tax=Listeria seeligeri TaxID=1640 RepID=UPI0022EA997D|nr:SDR family NAD(P)-dependent oxidoreductase [Listeria seeligeri]
MLSTLLVYIQDDPRKDKSTGKIDKIDVKLLTRTIQTNYLGAYSLSQKIINLQEDNEFLRIINISSGMGRLSEISEYAYAYSVSKLLLNTLTIAYSNVFSVIPKDFAIASICPGWVKTDMGTEDGMVDSKVAAEYICSIIDKKKEDINGRFLRYEEELDWQKKM